MQATEISSDLRTSKNQQKKNLKNKIKLNRDEINNNNKEVEKQKKRSQK